MLFTPKSNSQPCSFVVVEWNSWTYRFRRTRRSPERVFFPEVSRDYSTEEYRSPFASRCGELGRGSSLPHSCFSTPSTVDTVQICTHFGQFSVRVTWIKEHYRANASALRDTSTLPLGHKGARLNDEGGWASHQPIAESLTASVRPIAVSLSV